MATTNIFDIGRSQTVSDIKPTITAAAIPTHSSIILNIGLIITAATIAILPTVQDISLGSVVSLATADYAATITPTSVLPFMVSITNIGIEGGYSPLNPPGIGIQVIGFSNYIL